MVYDLPEALAGLEKHFPFLFFFFLFFSFFFFYFEPCDHCIAFAFLFKKVLLKSKFSDY